MKRAVFFLTLTLTGLLLFAQTDYSGQYSYSFKPKGNPPATEKERGPNGKLLLFQMEGNQYRFWLDVTIGWPSYHVGETDGTITFSGDTASFDNSFEDAEHPCILKFQIANNTIIINSQSSSFNCGFGNGVHADGEYKFDKTQPVFNNELLQKEYFMSPIAEVVTTKTQLFSDENCLYAKTQYFVKGDLIISIAENNKNLYTEYITPQGKFVYGWLHKSDIKIKKSK